MARIEVRTLTTSSQLNDFLDWPFLQQVFQLERTITISKTGKTRHEIVYGITSLSAEHASPDQLLQMLRSYWQIENCLHYPRDVTLHEDQTRFKKNSAAHIMAIINNLVLAFDCQIRFPLCPFCQTLLRCSPRRMLSLSYFEKALQIKCIDIATGKSYNEFMGNTRLSSQSYRWSSALHG